MYERIRDLREDHDLTQLAVADILHIRQTVYARYERGERLIPTRLVVQLAQYYHVNIDYLVGLTNDPRPLPPKE